MTKRKRNKPPKLTSTKPLTQLTGFDLLIGQRYQEGWFREAVPYPASSNSCYQCNSTLVMIWPLQKQIQAFGHSITKHCQIHECLNCHHEWEVSVNKLEDVDFKPKKLKLNKFQLAALIKLAKDKGLI